jgi:hypothetical protein
MPSLSDLVLEVHHQGSRCALRQINHTSCLFIVHKWNGLEASTAATECEKDNSKHGNAADYPSNNSSYLRILLFLRRQIVGGWA